VGDRLYIFHALDCIFEIEGGFPSEEKADIVMEALGILTPQEILRSELGTFDIDLEPDELQRLREE